MTLEETKSEEPEALEPQFALPQVGTVLDARYRMGRQLGSGGMGAVFEATHIALKRRYAIKFLRVELAGRSRSLGRFEREALLLGSLVHDNITSVIDFGYYRESSPYLVMEYVEGTTMRRLFDGERLPAVRLLSLMSQVCGGIAHAHNQGIIHRDLKPENLMVSVRSDGHELVKILDFGIAREVGGKEVSLTPTGADIGTPHYMAPEQARGEKQVDARADVYSVGVMLYEAVTGKKPHPGVTYNQVIFHLLTERAIPVRRLAPDCPPSLARLIEKCIRKDASDRFTNGQALLAAVLAVIDELNEAAPPLRKPGTRGSLRNLKFWHGVVVGGLLSGAVVGSLNQDAAPEAKNSSSPVSAMPTATAGAVPSPRPPPEEKARLPQPPRTPPISSTQPGADRTRLTPASRPARPEGTVGPAREPKRNARATVAPSSSAGFEFVTANPYE